MYRPLIAAVLVLAALSARADRQSDARPELPLEESAGLRALFALAPGVVADDGNGVTVSALAVEVVVARIGADGKLIRSCVSSEEEARRFLALPIEKLRNAEGHEQ